MATVRCPECGWVFRKESALREHLQTYHPDPAADETDAASPPSELPSPMAETRPVKSRWIVLGYAGAVLFPIAGLIIGAYLVTKGLHGHGFAAIAISIAVGAAGLLIDLDSGALAASLLLTSPVR
jgi:hypothetical protein